MPNSNATAAAELKDLIHNARLTSKLIARHLDVTESWLSRRLGGVVGLQIDDYAAIKNAIDELNSDLLAEKN